MTDKTTRPTIWAVTDGKPGMENQCLGLAESVQARLGGSIAVKRLGLRQPWRTAVPYWRWGLANAFDPSRDVPAAPWPDVLIASGRQSTAASLLARQASKGTTLTVQIQSPGIDARHFGVVIVPRHDRTMGANVVRTLGALHRVTPDRLDQARTSFADDLAGLPTPRVAVLIGGNNGVFRLDAGYMATLADQLAAIADSGVGLMVTTSRRTGEENISILRDRLGDRATHLWTGTGDNPYFGYLAWADAIIVTCDSVSMVSEAISTAKPVHVVHLPGGSAKFTAFHSAIEQAGCTRPFTGRLEHWSYAPPRDTEYARDAVLLRIDRNKD